MFHFSKRIPITTVNTKIRSSSRIFQIPSQSTTMSNHTDNASLTSSEDDAERKSAADEADEAAKNLKNTTAMADASILQGLTNPTIIDVRSAKEVKAAKGGEPVAGSINVPFNVDGQPQGTHLTTTQEFQKKLQAAEVHLSTENAYITHCTAGNTEYIGRGARAAALLRNLGYISAHNGGSADDIRTALKSN